MTAERLRLPVAVHVLLLDGEQVLLLRRHNTGFEDGRWGVPAGHLDGGETAVQAAIREAWEEAGVTIVPGNLYPACVLHRQAGSGERIDFFFTSRLWTGAVENREPQKCLELAWFPLGALPPDTVEYIRDGIARAVRGDWFGVHGWEHDR